MTTNRAETSFSLATQGENVGPDAPMPDRVMTELGRKRFLVRTFYYATREGSYGSATSEVIKPWTTSFFAAKFVQAMDATTVLRLLLTEACLSSLFMVRSGFIQVRPRCR